MEKLFHLKENGTNVKTEVMAGITTFLAMAYILAVNPSMLGDAGMNSQGVFMATALAAAVATIVMALLANYPIALASGMGLNAYFAYTVCLGELADQGRIPGRSPSPPSWWKASSSSFFPRSSSVRRWSTASPRT